MKISTTRDEVTDCTGLWGLIFGHKFQPRLDINTAYPPGNFEGMKAAILAAINNDVATALSENLLEKVIDGYRSFVNKNTVYVYDICVRCGQVVGRSVTISPPTTPAPAPSPHAGPQPSSPSPRVAAVPVVLGGTI